MALEAIRFDRIPTALTDRPNWILWRTGRQPKEPFQVNGQHARAGDPTTWATFAAVVERFRAGGYLGIGYQFAADDPFCGIDLDSCRNPSTGIVAPWAREIILTFATYAEVSPSQTGIKLFCIGRSPFDSGRKIKLPGESLAGKQPGLELYDRARYFAVTGWRLRGLSPEPIDCQRQLGDLALRYFQPARPLRELRDKMRLDRQAGPTDTIERARRYVAAMPPAIAGQGGHDATFNVACVLILGFALSIDQAYPVLLAFNQRCQPAWSDCELIHKLNSANSKPGRRGYLLDATEYEPDPPLPFCYVPRYGNARKYGLKTVRLTTAKED